MSRFDNSAAQMACHFSFGLMLLMPPMILKQMITNSTCVDY